MVSKRGQKKRPDDWNAATNSIFPVLNVVICEDTALL